MAAKKAEQNAAPGKAFILNESELETLQSTRGRKEEPSPYKADVAAALADGDVHGVSLTETVKGPWVQAQLRKAAKQNWGKEKGLKMISVFDRSENKSDDHPHGFVAYRVQNLPEDVAAESTSQ